MEQVTQNLDEIFSYVVLDCPSGFARLARRQIHHALKCKLSIHPRKQHEFLATFAAANYGPQAGA